MAHVLRAKCSLLIRSTSTRPKALLMTQQIMHMPATPTREIHGQPCSVQSCPWGGCHLWGKTRGSSRMEARKTMDKVGFKTCSLVSVVFYFTPVALAIVIWIGRSLVQKFLHDFLWLSQDIFIQHQLATSSQISCGISLASPVQLSGLQH